MLRRNFLSGAFATSVALATGKRDSGTRLAEAAQSQLGVTTGYDPAYTRIAYPNGDVPRTTGVCADVVIRAGRDALALDLQKLVHEDMVAHFDAYPSKWGTKHPDANIDHRRVLNLAVYWQRAGAALWTSQVKVAGDAFPKTIEAGDLLTWLLDGKLPHVGVVVSNGLLGPQIVHNIGGGVQKNMLYGFRGQWATGHFRWPVA
jgi:hypothetical protein